MDQVKRKARAKINLTLDVIARREDGYHELEMVMQSVSLYDSVMVKRCRKQGVWLSSNLPWLPNDERNLAYRGAALVCQEYGVTEGVEIRLEKRIPAAAGLAGGSSDCAAVIEAMDTLFCLSIPQEDKQRLGLRIGADIPFCIYKKTALAQGIGEKLTPLAECPHCYIVMVKPPVNISTASVFQNFSMNAVQKRPDTKKMIAAIASGALDEIGAGMVNVLETVVAPKYPQIEEIKGLLLEYGAFGAQMSGSGPTVFGIFPDKDMACRAADQARDKFSKAEVFVTDTYQGEEE